jgi:hypothetical protein
LKYGEQLDLPKVIVKQTEGGYFYYVYTFEDVEYKQMCEGDFDETRWEGVFDLVKRCGYFKGLN